ncbi:MULTISPECIES: endonuclease/exonuclease/phosphatase family protein [unclassified Nocardia]|uniref:endonuclease/exonuclease/phosphatase family protein n=1 Tax=unclassified Nocardia TaxID=2637762 RepID=UPI001CE3E16B|nr:MULTISPECIES: endonuclease/exonuclease/phosphatase family protein [unclassified Nocardia]
MIGLLRPRRMDIVFTCGAALLTVILIGHREVPDLMGLGIVLDTVAPWLGLLIPVLAVAALGLRAPLGVAATLVPLLVWAHLFGAWWASHPVTVGDKRLRVVTQNLYAGNRQPADTARALVAIGADLVALQEVTSADRAGDAILADAYPYHHAEGTVELWSRYPLGRSGPADVGAGWRRGLRALVQTPFGTIAVYVVHLPSARPGATADRDRGLHTLSAELTADRAENVVVLGDFNTTDTDRNWSGFAPGYFDVQRRAGTGPGFTWPAGFPIARPDHILVRGLEASAASTFETPGPDHRAVTAVICR